MGLTKKILFFILVSYFTACIKQKTCKEKDQVCDKSTVTLVNETKDTVFFGIGKNYYDDTLVPGAKKSLQGGMVKVTYNPKANCEEKKSSWSTWEINSTHGYWAFDVDRCAKKSTFRYNDAAKTSVSLYDTTDE